MSIDLGFDFIDRDSEWAKNIKHNDSIIDDDGIFIGNCYHTNSMINEASEKKKTNTNKPSSNITFNPYDLD